MFIALKAWWCSTSLFNICDQTATQVFKHVMEQVCENIICVDEKQLEAIHCMANTPVRDYMHAQSWGTSQSSVLIPFSSYL